MPEDEPLVVAFHKELSENTVRQRYFEFLSLDQRIAHERLVRICFNDYDRELALVAEVRDPSSKIIGIARLSRTPTTNAALMTMIISDAYHHQGLGTELVNQLIRVARKENLESIYAYILSENEGMLKICKRAGFTMQVLYFPVLKAELKL